MPRLFDQHKLGAGLKCDFALVCSPQSTLLKLSSRRKCKIAMGCCAGLHFTYSRDKRFAAREEALLAQESAGASASEHGRPSDINNQQDASEESRLLNTSGGKSRHSR